jgi:subtilisin family serine protease
VYFINSKRKDDNGHGTHTTGTAVGSTNTRIIGVAPEAQWIACRVKFLLTKRIWMLGNKNLKF